MNVNQIFENILIGAMILLAVLVLIAVLRSIIGPKMADRIIAINMIGTITMALIAILTVFLGEDYLADICLVYALISFLAVVVLTKIFTGYYRESHEIHAEDGKNEPITPSPKVQKEESNGRI